jgi:MFS family permease
VPCFARELSAAVSEAPVAKEKTVADRPRVDHPQPSPPRQSAAILALLVGSQFIIILDVSIVNVALPSIQRTFHISGSGLQDVVTAYAVAFGGPLMLGGRLADLVGRRTMFRIALVGFGAFSLLCGFAPSGNMLIFARGLQGLSASLLAPSALGLLTSTFSEGAARIHALSRFGAATMLGSLSGLMVGGVLITFAGWRSIFFVNAPITIVMTIAAGRLLTSDRTRRGKRVPLVTLLKTLDLVGACLVTGGLSVVVFALNIGSARGWESTEFLLLIVLGCALLLAFVVTEGHTRQPLLRFKLMEIETVRSGVILIFIFGVVGGASGLTMNLFVQNVLHYTPLQAGLALVPQGIVGLIVSRFSVRVFTVCGLRWTLCISFATTAVVIAVLSALITRDQTYAVLFPCFVVLGGSQVISTIGATMSTSLGVPAEELGVAGAMRQTSFQVGFALGVAVFASLAVTRTHQLVADGLSMLNALDAGYRLTYRGIAIVSACGSIVALMGLRHQAPRGKGQTGLDIRSSGQSDAPRLSDLAQRPPINVR